MNSIFGELFLESFSGSPYTDYTEYFNDLLKQVELMCFYYVKAQEEDIKRNYTMDYIRGLRNDEEKRAVRYIESRSEEIKDGFLAFDYVKFVYKLDSLECFCVLLSLLYHNFDFKTSVVSKYFKKKSSQEEFSYELILKIFYCVQDVYEIKGFLSIKSKLVEKMAGLCFNRETMEVNSRLVQFILSNGEQEIQEDGITTYIPDQDEPLPIREAIAQKIEDVASTVNEEEPVYFYLYGDRSIGKRSLVKRFAQITDVAVVFVDVAQLTTDNEKEFYNTLILACRESLLCQGVICFYNFDVFLPAEEEGKYNRKDEYSIFILNLAKKFSSVIFVLSEKPQQNLDIIGERLWIDIPLEYPNKEESILLWEECLKEIPIKEELHAFEIANKFSFTPGKIVGTAKEAIQLLLWQQEEKLSKKDFYRCAYKQVSHDLGKQATLIYAKHYWDQLILPDKEKQMLKNACDQVTYKHVVYDRWGFDKRLAYGKGVSMLFAGPPGTGKTMAAQVVANELDIEIYKVDLSQIVSKYIGETEKNLNILFQEAKKSNVILFFDETDALLGKRTEVKDSHDKNANLETSYLLQKMEEYDGISVLSTNYLENIDSAFFRRITYVIHFPFPDVASRKGIWKNIFPKETPLDPEIDFDYLAQQFEISGGNIKNIAVTSAFLAAKHEQPITMRHILQAIQYELTKQGKVLIKEDFGEQSYLLQ